MARVKFLDLQAQYRSIKEEIDEAVLRVLDSAQYVLGPEVEAFEKEFAAAHNAVDAVAVNTGTSALHLALLAAAVGPGDEVLVPAMTFTATAAAVAYTGATPVLVDVDAETFTMDPAKVEAKITPATRAIMPVHLYGQAADLDRLAEIARAHSLILVEDAAQAHLATYRGRKVGGIGHVAGFSFYPGKNLGAYGEGGLATTNDPEIARKMRLLRDWGQERKYHHMMLAYNYRMDAIQGAILRVKLRHLDKWTNARHRLAEKYQERLGGLGIEVAGEAEGRRHVYHIFSVFHPERDALQEHLSSAGIQSGKHYPVPLHMQEAYPSLGNRLGDFPIAEKVAAEQLSLPLYPEMSDDDVDFVSDTIRDWLRSR
jgi:dTDP-4-amino-4,6-dideoxygalactose transaminase